MSLDIKKIYIDTRFKTADSKSHSEFTIDLPREFNIPDETICYVSDIVMPVSFRTIDNRNNNVYFSVHYETVNNYYNITLENKNYNGSGFVDALKQKIVDITTGLPITWDISYDYLDNKMTLSFVDTRTNPPDLMTVTLYSNDSLMNDEWLHVVSDPKTINYIIALKTKVFLHSMELYTCYLDLHTIRNLYLSSSALASYDTISNFGNDTIIKKIPVTGNPNEMLFHGASEGFDYLNLSKRSLRYIDFRLTDAFYNVVDLRDTHFSFSLVFTSKG